MRQTAFSAHAQAGARLWPASYAITEWNDANAAALEKLVRKAVG